MYRKTLCSTLLNNDMDYLTITSPYKNNENKHGIVLMARVHPGETVSSWVMKGALDFITSDHEDAEFIRNNFIIKVIPMINPDGVICGNFRTSVSGADLNRRWRNTSQTLYPEVFYSKEMTSKLAAERSVELVIDLHGHSNQYNVFIYGNTIRGQPRETKMYPYVISKHSEIFFYSMSKFKMQKFKRGTARVTLFHDIGPCSNIVCVETSSGGLNAGKYKGNHWSQSLLMTMGRDLFKSYVSYMTSTRHKFILRNCTSNVIDEAAEKKKIENELEDMDNKIMKENEEIGKTNSDSESGGSDSEPSGDNLDMDQLAKFLPIKRKKKSKTKKKTNKFNLFKIKSQLKKVAESEKQIEGFKEKIKSAFKQNDKKEIPKININVNININKTIIQEEKAKTNSKVDSFSQTEDIFFKFPWTFFKNKYKIITPSYKRMNLENNNSISSAMINPNSMNGLNNNNNNNMINMNSNRLNEKRQSSFGLKNFLINNNDLPNNYTKNNLVTLTKSQIKKGNNLNSTSINRIFSNSLGNSVILSGNLPSNLNMNRFPSQVNQIKVYNPNNNVNNNSSNLNYNNTNNYNNVNNVNNINSNSNRKYNVSINNSNINSNSNLNSSINNNLSPYDSK